MTSFSVNYLSEGHVSKYRDSGLQHLDWGVRGIIQPIAGGVQQIAQVHYCPWGHWTHRTPVPPCPTTQWQCRSPHCTLMFFSPAQEGTGQTHQCAASADVQLGLRYFPPSWKVFWASTWETGLFNFLSTYSSVLFQFLKYKYMQHFKIKC